MSELVQTRIPSAVRPPLPTIQPNGAYDPVDLRRYLIAAQRAGMMEAEIARHLRVPLHRAIYHIRRAK